MTTHNVRSHLRLRRPASALGGNTIRHRLGRSRPGPSAPRNVGVAARHHGRRHDSRGCSSWCRGRDGDQWSRPRRRWAPGAAIVVGFGSAILFTYAHLLPTFWPGYQDSFCFRSAHQRDMVFLVERAHRDRQRHRVRDRRLAGQGAQSTCTSAPVLRHHTREDVSQWNGTLFFDGACGMCTRSRRFPAEDRSNRQCAHRAVAESGSRGTFGHHTGEPAGIGPVAGFLGHRLFRRARRQRGFLRGGRHSNPVGDLSDSRYPLHRGRRLPMGGRHTTLPTSRARHTVLRVGHPRPPAELMPFGAAAGGAQSVTPGR